MFSKLKMIPWFGYVWGVGLFALQFGLYWLGHNIAVALNLNPFLPKISAIDDALPVIAIFVLPYVYSYIFWIMGPIAVSLCDRKHFNNYIAGMLLAMLIGFAIFSFLPSYMDRTAENLYGGLGTDIFSKLLKMVYDSDGSDMAYNLCPSFHCMISVYCYLGVWRRREISKGFKIYTLIMAILICLSTMFTKQHYFLDFIVGTALAIATFALVKLTDLGNRCLGKHEKKSLRTI